MDSIEPVHPKRDREINAGRNESEREPSGSIEEGAMMFAEKYDTLPTFCLLRLTGCNAEST